MSADPILPAGRVAEISVNCRNLRDRDWFSKSDPFVVLFVQPSAAAKSSVIEFLDFRVSQSEHQPAQTARTSCARDKNWLYAGETEVVWNELSPDFVVKFFLPMDVHEVEETELRFEVYDMDKFDAPLADQDFLGAIETSFSHLLEPQPRVRMMTLCDRRLRPKQKLGQLNTMVEIYDIAPPAHYITLQTLFAINSGFPSDEQMFYVVSRAFQHLVDGKELWTRVYRSGPMTGPTHKREWGFQDVSITEHHLTAGLFSRKLRIELFIHHKKGAHLRIGSTCEFTLEDIERGHLNGSFRIAPDEYSGAGLRSAEVAVTSQLFGRKAIDREVLSASSSLLSSGSSVRSSLAGLDSSAIVFKFFNFSWNAKGKKPLRALSGSSLR